MPRIAPLRAALVLLLLASASPGSQEDPLRESLRSPDAKERLAAVRKIALGDRPDAEDLLLTVVEDRDGEVAQKACEALAAKGTEKSVRPLAELAIGGWSRSIRLAAAAALGARAPEAGAKYVMNALNAKDDVVPARGAEALAEIRHSSAREKLRGALRSRDPALRREAARALGALRDPSVLKELEPLFLDADVGVRAGAAEGLARAGNLSAVPMLLSELQSDKLLEIVERRVSSSVRRLLWSRKGEEEAASMYKKVIDAYRNEKTAIVSARLARLLGSLARSLPPEPPAPPPEPGKPGETAAPERPVRPPLEGPSAEEGEGPLGDPEAAVKALAEVGLAHKDPVARRAAVAALGRIGGAAALEHLKRTVSGDEDERVRFHSLRGWRRWRNARDEEAFQLFCDRLRYDKSARVREEAAVGLGLKEVEGAFDTLFAALKDKSWEVAAAAAVSLGKTRDPKAVEGLATLLPLKEWRLRGAAAAGIGWTRRKEAIPVLIGLLEDPEPCVARTAWEFLKRLVDKEIPFRKTEWEAFWKEKGPTFEIIDREREIRDAQKYGYALNDRDVYENLDVIVFKSRGDTIQNLLEILGIRYRLTQSANIKKDGVQPFGVFVSNCTGEMQPDDHERVQWFVHTGGALFGSCWAIDKTIGQEFPESMRKFPGAKGQVLDQVRAEEMPTESEYLRGVFPGVVRPIYELYGAFLIEVLDPEWLEVLIDSPDCATGWGGNGNLAAWFTVGHGVVMGSSNHFDRQTMSKLQTARGVSIKTEADRRGFAADHFGFSWERIRELDAKGTFARQSDAEKEVTDLSAFRFLTNFVRRKRIVDL
ncbi:MAG: HEAT repeat domain-containing protein [Planctomycetes bacterium]|nr:HEAT repeat domain-containing protein [Planctomycetota bacterium]